MAKDLPKPKKPVRSNSFVIPLATVSGLLILFLIYVFWYVSAEDKYYNDRAFRVLSVLSESFAGKVRTIESVLGASAAFDNRAVEPGPASTGQEEAPSPSATTALKKNNQPNDSGDGDTRTAAQYIARYLEEYGVAPEQVHASWTQKCREASRDGKLSLSLEDREGFSLRAVYTLPDTTADCKPAKKDEPLEVAAIIHPQASVRSLFGELNEGFFEDLLIADADGVVLYQQSNGGVQISDLNDLVRLRPDGSLVVALSDKSDATGSAAEKSSGEKAHNEATVPHSDPKPVAAKSTGPFSQISGSGNIVNLQLADASVRLYLQPSSLAIQKRFRPSRLVFCGLRTAKRVQADSLSLSNTLVIWGTLLLPLVFALGWPLLKVFYVSPKERLQVGDLLALILTVLVGTVVITLTTLNWSYTTWQDSISRDHLTKLAERMKFQVRLEMQQALRELDRLSTQPVLLPSHTSKPKEKKDSWQVAQYFETYSASYLKGDNNSTPPYSYFRYAVSIDVDGWQRAKFTADWPTPRVNSRKETYFQEARLSNFDTFGSPGLESSTPANPTLFRLDLSTSPNTGEFLPILSVPYSGFLSSAAPSSPHLGSPKLNYHSPLQEKLLVTKFESLVDPALPPGYGFAVLNRAGKVQFHSISRRNLLEDFLEETQFNPELLSLLQQGGSDFFRARYLGRAQVLYVTPLEMFQHPALTLVVFRDDDRATAGNKAVVVVYCLLALAHILFLWVIVIVYFRWRKADYPLQGIWPTQLRQEPYVRVSLTNFILFFAFLSGYGSLSTNATLFFALPLGLVAMLLPLAEVASLEPVWVYGIRVLAFAYLLLLAASVRGLFRVSFLIFLAVALGFVFSRYFSSMIRSFSKDPVHWKNALKHTYSFVAISLLLSVVVGPCIGFFKFAFETVERRAVQVDQIELSRQLDKRGDRIHRYYDRIHAQTLEAQRRDDTLDRHDLAFLNCLGPGDVPPSGGKLLQDNPLEEGLGDVAEMFQSQEYSGMLELERAGIPREFDWRVSPEKITSDSGNTCSPLIILERRFDPPSSLVVSAMPLWPGFSAGGKALLFLAILFLFLWILLVTRRVFLIDWRDAPELEIIRVSEGIPSSTIIIGHPKSGKSGTAVRNSQGYHIDIAELVATREWDLILPSVPVIILDHFECGITDPALNLKKLELLERLDHVEHRKIILLSTVDPMFYLVSGFPGVVSANPDEWASSVQILDRWAALLSGFHKARFEDKSTRRFSRRLGVEQKKRCQPGQGDRKSRLALMLINVVRQECDHTGPLRRIGFPLLLSRLQNLQETKESFLREEIMEDVLDRADAYYRSLWSTCTKDERLVLYQLAKDGWANPKNRKAIQDLIRRGLVVRSSGFHIMNRSFRQFVLDYQYPEEVAAWDQEIKLSSWRAVRSSLLVAGVVLGVWMVYSQQQVVHLALGYVGVLGGAAATVGSLVSALRNRGSRPGTDAAKTA